MDLIRRLHVAIQNKDREGIEAAVAAGADMDHVWGMQGTALCQAISTNHIDSVTLLLELGCDVNAEDYDGGFPLSLAIRKCLPDIALLLISTRSCDVNVLDPVSKQRPLCSAVTEGLCDVVETLVQDQRCNITQGNSVGNSALHLALLHRQENITRILARCEGFRFLHNLAGHAPVHIVATLGYCRGLELLYPTPARTAEAYHKTDAGGGKGGRSVSMTRASHSTTALQRELNQRVTYTGDTALHLAVREKHSELAERLIALGAAVDIQNNSGQTALLLACAAENTELAIHLLKSGAPPNLAGHLRLQQRTLLATHSRESSLTPLHIAASANNAELVKALCDYGADVNNCDERGRSALYVALLNGAGEVALYLLSKSAEMFHTPFGGSSLLHAVCQCTSHAAEITAALIDRGCSINIPNHQGNLPLHEALCWENVDVVRVLLERGASVHTRGECQAVPLSFAARTGRVEMAALLLAAGADVNGADPQGDKCSVSDSDEEEWSPLREALQAGMVEFARYLVDAGCDLSKEKYLFKNPLHSNLTTTGASTFPDLDDLDDSDGEDEDDADDDIPDILQDDRELLAWLQEKACNAPPLIDLCMETVRSVFRQGDPPFALMLALPLPEKIIAKLLYRASI